MIPWSAAPEFAVLKLYSGAVAVPALPSGAYFVARPEAIELEFKVGITTAEPAGKQAAHVVLADVGPQCSVAS